MTRREFLHKIEQQLLKRREALRRTLAGDDLLTAMYDSGVGDEADAAIAGEQAELRSQMAQVESRELVQIDEAIAKIRSGQYGRCETCDRPIAPLRLKVLPYVTECISCARREERREAPASSRYMPTNRIAAFQDDDSETTVDDAELELS